jgi:hypothetical protein
MRHCGQRSVALCIEADASIGLCVCLASVTHILAILAWSRSAEALFVHLSQRTDLAALWGVLCVVD